ncbi:hypothetical protein PENTCL1PPCAC_4588 [Pristionchus entomophagus]|uniref:Innexin n=1 Tax=Pristionchus entomophagus TaxID=358040 RepID=A0AAV5SH87_9BILA|nr:hypothetical protein PENTCL1PPCAC_4588 [Pristionchus entomophagus]
MTWVYKKAAVAIQINSLRCFGEKWRLINLDGTINPDQNVTDKDSTVHIRCRTYIQPPGEDFTVHFIWTGFLLFILLVAIYRFLVAYGIQPLAFLWRKSNEGSVEEVKTVVEEPNDSNKDKIE